MKAMQSKTEIKNYFLSLLFMLFISGCGPIVSQQTRFEWKPYDKNEYKQEKDGVIVEIKERKEFPDTFYAQVQACNEYGQPLITTDQTPVMEKVKFASANQYWEQLAITNNTDHVLRLNQVVIRLFDPAGNQNEPISKDDLIAQFSANRPCTSSNQAVNQFRLIKIIDRNVEILPSTTFTGWLAFTPPSLQTPGIWKLAVYEVPAKVDESGKVTKTTKFELKTFLKKYSETYRQEGVFEPKKLMESKEVTD